MKKLGEQERIIIDKENFDVFLAHVASDEFQENPTLDRLINRFVGWGDICPLCGGTLDTGFSCMKCGKHFVGKQQGSATCEN